MIDAAAAGGFSKPRKGGSDPSFLKEGRKGGKEGKKK